MKLYNLLGGAILTLLLVVFLVIPQYVFALDLNFFNFSGEDDYQILSEFESRKILQHFPDILYNKWTSLKGDGYSSPREQTAVCLLKYISTLDMFNYFFIDLPLDTSFSVAKEGLDMARLIGTEDTSGMIGKLEKGTVNVAVNYLKDYFFRNQIKVSFGAMRMNYETEFGEINDPLQYIIMYKRIDDKRSKVVARIYSPKEIIPPASRASIGVVLGFVNSLGYGEKLSPFVVEINGIMDDGLFGSYYWDEKSTTIKTVFPETVPDFGLKPKTWQEKYITDPIKNTIESFSGIINFFTGNNNNLTEYVFKSTTDEEKINKEVKSMNSGDSLETDYPIKEAKEDVAEKKKTETTKEKEIKAVKEVKEEKKETEKKAEEKTTPVICSKSSQYVSSHDIIINEVAWMGTENSANDEWIELKNVSTSDINLKGWILRDEEDQIDITFEDIAVPRGSFLLLERTDDDSVPSKKADLIYKGSLSNSEEALYLFDSTCLLRDFVSGNPKWPAGDSSTRKTMERNDDFNGWHTYSGNGNGTPRENNSSLKQEATASVAVATIGSSTGAISGGGVSIPVVTYCSQSGLPTPDTSKIIINEVAWMGSVNSANDEWIELKNVSNEVINLNNWQLLDASENVKIVFGSSEIINPQGFYLLERTNDDSVPNIKTDDSDTGGPYTGGLSNSNESLRLFNSNCQLMDEVLAAPDWPAGDNALRKTMERNVDLSGWHTYSLSSADTLSGLWGTPKAENSLKSINNEEEPPEEDDPPEEEEPVDNSNHLLITEIQTGENGGSEYVEIYNQTDSPINLCPDEADCFYLSYYASGREWYDPYHNWKFPSGAIIDSNSYYVIDIFGDSEVCMPNEACNQNKWKIENAGHLSNSAGSLALFSNDPKYVKPEPKEGEDPSEITNEEKAAAIASAVALKIDAFSWRGDSDSSIVKEGESFHLISEAGKVMGRKWSDGKYRDTDNNLNDFQLEKPSLRNHVPKPPERVQDLVASINEEQKNSVILSWTSSIDEDTLPADLDYEIYYSRNNQIDDINLINIKDYTNISIVSGENNKRSVAIKDLFYDSNYYFKIIAKDKEKNVSPLSNEVSFVISGANHQKRAPYYDFKRSGHSQFSGPVGTSFTANVIIEGDQQFTFNNDFTSTSVIDENGTIYFGGSNNRSWNFYALSPTQKKWSINCPSVCGFFPSLGKDGTIYFSSEHSVYAVSPSGKIIWKKDYTRVFNNSIIIDSNEKIYFLASKETMGPVLFSVDKNGLEEKLYDVQEMLNGTVPSSTELVVDDSNNIYFAINDYVLKYSNGTVTKKQLFPKYGKDYSGTMDNKATINRVNVSFGGILLVDLNNGYYVTPGECYPVLYAIDNNLSEVWFKDNYYGPIGFNESEFYYSRTEIGSYPMITYLGAADITDGKTKWERRFSWVNFVTSDSANRIYFTTSSAVLGYDSSSMPEDTNSRLFYYSPGYYFGETISIGNQKTFFSDTQRVYRISTSQ